MSGERNIRLSEDQGRFIEDQIRRGRHGDASDVVREALARYERHVRAADVRKAAVAGIVAEGEAALARGEYVDLSSPSDLDAFFQRARPSGKARG